LKDLNSPRKNKGKLKEPVDSSKGKNKKLKGRTKEPIKMKGNFPPPLKTKRK